MTVPEPVPTRRRKGTPRPCARTAAEKHGADGSDCHSARAYFKALRVIFEGSVGALADNRRDIRRRVNTKHRLRSQR